LDLVKFGITGIKDMNMLKTFDEVCLIAFKKVIEIEASNVMLYFRIPQTALGLIIYLLGN
jgi:hypothetical protein